MDFQLPRQLNKPLYFTKYCTSGAWLYNNKQTKMGPKGIWDTQYLAIFLVATTKERGAVVWKAEARLLQPGCQHLFPDPPLSVCGAGGQETQFSLLLLALGPCHHSAKLSTPLDDSRCIHPHPLPPLGNQRLDGREKVPCHSSD